MQTPILVMSGVVALGALIAIGLLLKMIMTGDYSLILNGSAGPVRLNREEERGPQASKIMPAVKEAAANMGFRELAMVHHFAHDLAEFGSEEQRKQAAEKLEGILQNKSLSRIDQSVLPELE